MSYVYSELQPPCNARRPVGAGRAELHAPSVSEAPDPGVVVPKISVRLLPLRRVVQQLLRAPRLQPETSEDNGRKERVTKTP